MSRGAPEPVAALEGDAVLAWRAARQHLAQRAPASHWRDVVRDLLGLHAQLLSSAEQALAARVDDLPADTVAQALWEDRELVKTWAMRGTLHLLLADDLGLVVGAHRQLKPRYEVGAWLRATKLSEDQARAFMAAIPRALGRTPRTREQLAARLVKLSDVAHLEERLKGGFGDLLKPAAFEGLLCFADNKGRNVRFTRPAVWLGGAPAEPADAMAQLTRRYLGAYGPATREAFARWFGTPSAAQAGRWLAALGDEVVPVDVAGTTCWLLAADVDAVAATERRGEVRLLPAFDPLVVAAPREEAWALGKRERALVYRPQGWLTPVVTVDGRIAGTWERDGDTVRASSFADVPRAGLEAEAGRLGAALAA